MPDELLFTVHGSTAIPAVALTLAEAGLRERDDLQEWVIAHPEIIGPDILIVTMEFDQWESSRSTTADRLDILGLHSSGQLVVAELKRDRAPETVEMQALKYAALASRFTVEKLAQQHARFLIGRGEPIDEDSAADILARHADMTPESLRRPRVVLLASDYPETTAATAVWLSEMGIDITLMQYRAYRTGSEISISVSQLYPVPTVEEFMFSPRQAEVRAVEETRRRRADIGTVAKLVAAGTLNEGAELIVRPYGINQDLRDQVESWLGEDAARRSASWRNDEAAPILWLGDGNAYSPTAAARLILREATGVDRSMRGGDWWVDSEGRSLVDLAKAVGNWDETSFRQALEEFLSEPQLGRVLEVLDHGIAHPRGSSVYWGGGQFPSANMSFSWPGSNMPYGAVVWSIYCDPVRTVFAFNFQWMSQVGVPDDELEKIARSMRPLPGVEALYEGLAESGYRKRPSIPVETLFSDPAAPSTINRCVDDLLNDLWK